MKLKSIFILSIYTISIFFAGAVYGYERTADYVWQCAFSSGEMKGLYEFKYYLENTNNTDNMIVASEHHIPVYKKIMEENVTSNKDDYSFNETYTYSRMYFEFEKQNNTTASKDLRKGALKRIYLNSNP